MNELYCFMSDLWRFLKQYGRPDGSDAYWEAVSEDATAMDTTYGASRAKHMMILDAIDILREEERKIVASN